MELTSLISFIGMASHVFGREKSPRYKFVEGDLAILVAVRLAHDLFHEVVLRFSIQALSAWMVSVPQHFAERNELL
jgi:hypothetical protein